VRHFGHSTQRRTRGRAIGCLNKIDASKIPVPLSLELAESESLQKLGELRQVPLGAPTVGVQLRAEWARNFPNSCRVRTEGACGVPPSQRLRETTGPTFQRSKTSGGLTTSGDDPKTTRATVSPTFHKHWRKVMKFGNVSGQKSGHSIAIDLQMTYHTYWLVCWKHA
jgi:hypothetical protein